MAQRNSGRTRIPRDEYNTPAWVTTALCRELAGTPRLPRGSNVWEPAAGKGQMVAAFEAAGLNVIASDIVAQGTNIIQADFLTDQLLPFGFDLIGSNPPYKQAEAFVRRALKLAEANRAMVAMLLGADFDSGKTRADMFADHPAWGCKIVLTDRIWWFDPKPGDKGPSENHAWYVWDWKGSLGRTLRYAGMSQDERSEHALKRKVLA